MIPEIKYCIQCGSLLKEKIIEKKLRKFCPNCGYIHYINPLPIVAIIVRNEDKILLVKRGIEPEKGKWVLPGGFIDGDETCEEAALRELKEETNITAKSVKLIKVVSSKSPLYGPIIMLGYEALDFTGKPVPGDDAIDVKFENIKNLDIVAFKSHKIILEEYLASHLSNT